MIRSAGQACRTLAAGTLVVLVAACGREVEITPPAMHYGQDICSVCGMIVTDERYAASLLRREEGRLLEERFDDVGCLLRSIREEQPPVVAMYVADVAGGTWVPADRATFLYSVELPTPMASGIAAFANADDAATRAGELNGELLDLATLRRRDKQGPLGAAAPMTSEVSP